MIVKGRIKMKSVLISIQPKWCELIANGKKTVEVRKTRPKIETPFKCYIYMTKAYDTIFGKGNPKKVCVGGGRVIGEFVCDKIVEFENSWYDPAFYETSTLSCVDVEELSRYIGKNDYGYGWHISNLVIYDKPKELSEFFHYCGDNPKCDGCEAHYYSNTECGKEEYCCSIVDGYKPIKRPPQSWCYVYVPDTNVGEKGR